jgi:hypothetical protein
MSQLLLVAANLCDHLFIDSDGAVDVQQQKGRTDEERKELAEGFRL